MNSQHSIVRCRRPAMASLFEIWLAGEDEEHLSAVGEAALDEIVRIERLLSLFDPASEISRINREAARRPVRVDAEVCAVLTDCLRWRSETDGSFDVTVGQVSRPARDGYSTRSDSGRSGDLPHVALDEHLRTVQFTAADVQINLGGFGKGYALDAAANILRQFGVNSALLHGGTSSVLAVGAQPDGSPWKIGIRDPLTEADDAHEIEQIGLIDAGFSNSAVFHANQPESDIIDPSGGQTLTQPTACAAVAQTATVAEVWSTAALVLGKSRLGKLLHASESGPRTPRRIAWLDIQQGISSPVWIYEQAKQ